MRSHKFFVFISLIILFAFSSCAENKSSFVFTENGQGIELSEDGNPIYFYQRQPKTTYDERFKGNSYNNYFHPLFSVEGDTLTEEFPDDHPYHRGIFWAWHQVFIGDESVGNGWVLDDIYYDIEEMNHSIVNNTARLNLNVYWKSSIWQNETPYIHEQTTVIVHSLENNLRKIDFEISLKGLVPDVSLGGADNERGYGGYCLRLKTPEDLIFTSENGQQEPLRGQTPDSPWMNFSGSFGPNAEKSEVTLISHPDTPNYPPAWILRQERSMQNVVFPGRQRTEIPMDNPVVLKYRLVIHGDDAIDADISRLQAEYK